MGRFRYRGRHLIRKPNAFAGPAAAGTATAVLFAAPAAAATKHRVRPGETLSGIAQRYGVAVSSLARDNDLSDPDLIMAGTRLRISGRGSSASRPARRYRIRPGDTLSSIAARFGTSVARIATMNKIADPNTIIAGRNLRVPRGGSDASGGPVDASPSSSSVGALLERSAVRHGQPASLVKAVAWQESGWQQDVVSSAGAIGVMQVMPGTADYVNDVLGAGSLDVRRARGNIELGVRYLDHLSEQMPTTRKALAAYYTGPGNVGKRLSKIQRTYVRSVEALRARF